MPRRVHEFGRTTEPYDFGDRWRDRHTERLDDRLDRYLTPGRPAAERAAAEGRPLAAELDFATCCWRRTPLVGDGRERLREFAR